MGAASRKECHHACHVLCQLHMMRMLAIIISLAASRSCCVGSMALLLQPCKRFHAEACIQSCTSAMQLAYSLQC